MSNWNVAINLYEHTFKRAFKLLQGLGAVSPTEFFNVLVMEVSDIHRFLETLKAWIVDDPSLLKVLARVVPVTSTFTFQSPAEFETKAKEAVLQWLPQLASKKFYVRMHRRGFKGRLSSLDEEHFLDGILLEALEKNGTPGRISFEDPDEVVVVETVGQQAGLACWTREEMQRYPFLRIN
jgi:tRNA(Ser,Leu) C12 N-acetylase TAN1